MNIIMKKAFARIYFLIVAACFSGNINAAGYFFYIQLTDKNNSPYSLSNPSAYLSERAIERRAFFNIPVDSTDLPVNPQYINQLTDKGLGVYATTKWLNGVTVLLKDSAQIEYAKSFSFVKSVQYTGKTYENSTVLPAPSKVNTADYNYGEAFQQISQLNGHALHQNGFLGENIHIAVIDAGFRSVNTNPGFQLMRNEGRLLGTKDFVNPLSDIFAEDSHGAFSLSAMASEIDGTHVGTAPKASYLLLRTEATIGEYLYEPDLWISAMEYADSLGVDVSTTSLGYTTFDDPAMDYKYSDLDGKTARASIVANLAFNKGILVVNSAGNEGNKPWKHIGVPADAEGVLTVGAVNKDSIRSFFSSFGPTADGRTKPNLCANGSTPRLLHADGSIFYGSGTSFSGPIIAGLAACYLQAAKTLKPSLSLNEIRNNIYESSSRYLNPNNEIGYGIPDFNKSLNGLLFTSIDQISSKNLVKNSVFKIYIGENNPYQIMEIPLEENQFSGFISLYSAAGQLIFKQNFSHSLVQIDTKNLSKGIYIVKIERTQ